MGAADKKDFTIWDSDLGAHQKKSLLIILQTFCTLILLSLGTTAFVQGDLALALGDGIVAAVFVGTTAYLLKTGKIKPVAWIGLIALGALFTYLLFEGGVNYTGYVWLPTYPMLTIFLLGPLRGGILAGIVIGVFLVGRLFFPQLLGPNHPYSFDFMLRFYVSISVIIFVTVYMEMAWKEAQRVIKKKNKLLHDLSHLDSLTGVHNRRHFDQELLKQWAQADRTKSALSLLMIDVDHFKKYNDRYGHQAGDDALTAIAQALCGQANRKTDTVARYGGEEYAIVLPATDFPGAVVVSRRILGAIVALKIDHADGNDGKLSVSIGIASHDELRPIATAAELLKQADESLYAAKTSGRGTFRPAE